MISFTKSTLDMNKLHMLLLERRSLIIKDFLNHDKSDRHFQNFKLDFDGDSIVLSCSSPSNPLKLHRILEVSDDRGLDFILSGSLLTSWNRASHHLTIDDLLKFGILDESKVAYVATYEASTKPYGTECRLLGVYNSFAELQLQFSRLIQLTESVEDYRPIDDVEVNVVKLNALEDLYLNGYQE